MDEIRKIYKKTGNLHHANLLIGDRKALHETLIHFLEKDLEISTHGNPDFLDVEYDVFGIDESRMLKTRMAMRAIEERKIAIISFNSITSEAQNSLLKIFEDGPSQTVFFVIAPTLEIFIPTLLSRFFVAYADFIDREGKGTTVEAKEARNKEKSFIKKFLSSLPAQRIELVADLIEKKDKTETINFFNDLENLLHDELLDRKMDSKIASACDEIIKCKGFLYDRSPSIKMILEHISCNIPTL